MSLRTLDGALRRSAQRTPDAVALRSGDRSVTYAELAGCADAVAGGLHGLGVRRGDRVAIALPNGSDAAFALYGALRAGAAVVPINPATRPDRLRYLLDHSGASAAVTTPEVAAAAGVRAVHVDDLVRAAAYAGPAPIELDLAAILYTSGSTGHPKGVALTHGNLAFATDSISEYLQLSHRDRVLSVLPLSFGYGLTQLLTCVLVGAHLILEMGFGFPGPILETLESERITGMAGVPTIFRVLTSRGGARGRSFEHLRFLTNAGAGLPPPTAAALRAAFPGARLYAMYGQTECIRVCYLPPEEFDRRPGSVGIPIPGTEAWVEDETGAEVPDGEVGELVVRGPHVMQGYWGDVAGTSARLREGRWPWEKVLHTGDLFRRDADGYLTFVSRTDDIIKSRGEKVAPREIEEVLLSAPGVAEAVVVGVEDDLLGQAVEAHVAPEHAHVLDPRMLRRFCAERLEDHLVPRRVVVHAELPKSANGKIDRLALADAA